MILDELKKQLKSKDIPVTNIWLENQYPARPSERLSTKTFLNYQNIQDFKGLQARKTLEEFLAKNPEAEVVIVAELTKDGKPKKKFRMFLDNEARYYSMYELFCNAAHMEGFIEIFHNIKKK